MEQISVKRIIFGVMIGMLFLAMTACGNIRTPNDVIDDEIAKIEHELKSLEGQRRDYIKAILGEPDQESIALLTYQYETVRAQIVLNQDLFESYYLEYVKQD